MGDTQKSQTISILNQGIAEQAEGLVGSPATAGLCAKRGVACLVSNSVKRVGTEESRLGGRKLQYGSVGRVPGNRCLYPELDFYSATLRKNQ
jgi:hypothetical protein